MVVLRVTYCVVQCIGKFYIGNFSIRHREPGRRIRNGDIFAYTGACSTASKISEPKLNGWTQSVVNVVFPTTNFFLCSCHSCCKAHGFHAMWNSLCFGSQCYPVSKGNSWKQIGKRGEWQHISSRIFCRKHQVASLPAGALALGWCPLASAPSAAMRKKGAGEL